MIREINRCMGCMNEKLYSGTCEICGYADTPNPAGCLAPKTMLTEKYIAGKLISKNGEGNIYLGCDLEHGRTVEIKEFMPETLCRRGADGETVEVLDGALPLFKSYLSDFAELNKVLIDNTGISGIEHTYEIFAANVTGYVVTEHIEAASLSQYLEAVGGKKPWPETAEIFAQVFDALEKLHSHNIIHRGVSPETVVVTKDRRLILTSIEISAARTSESQIPCDLCHGYTAPEQYDLSEKQGSWTDVYGLSAVLYKVLTGTDPQPANERRENDRLAVPAAVESSVPPQVSDAIFEGMCVDPTKRIRTVEELRKKLFAVPAVTAEAPAVREHTPDGPVSPKVSVKFDPEERLSETKKPRKSAPKKRSRKKSVSNFGMIAGLIIFFAMVAALVIAIIYFSEQARDAAEHPITAATSLTTEPVDITVDEPEETETTKAATKATTAEPAGDKLMLPDFVNRFFNQTFESRYNMLRFETEYEYSDEFAENVIMEQDIPAGTQVTSGTTIKLKVSKGAAYTYLPDYIAKKLSDYTNELQKLGVRFETVPEETDEVKAGYVVRCSKEIGDKVYISENEIVTVYYAVKPTVTTTVPTEPPETTTKKTKRTKETTAPPEDTDTPDDAGTTSMLDEDIIPED
ncbi:MAG: PASTA domain-containing protein [Ruminiclostridium sp.]|nr:PASTA domain-containing protein [Ruminiclostridium sp.]